MAEIHSGYLSRMQIAHRHKTHESSVYQYIEQFPDFPLGKVQRAIGMNRTVLVYCEQEIDAWFAKHAGQLKLKRGLDSALVRDFMSGRHKSTEPINTNEKAHDCGNSVDFNEKSLTKISG
jgi:predicted DNA-binding transcriptional regulator AlpA